jgi:hypothetical protein
MSFEYCNKRKKEEEERKRREYEEWRKKKLGECYAQRLSYSVGEIVVVELGKSILDVLKPGDRVLIALDTSADPCIIDNYYVEGYVPIYSKHCRCKRGEYDVYAIVQLPLYIRGALRERRYNIPPLSDYEVLSWFIYRNRLVVAEYRGDGIVEIVDTDDYDYYLHLGILGTTYDNSLYNFDDIEIEGAAWHDFYYVAYSDTIYDWHRNKVAELDICCYDDVWSYFITLLLIRHNEVAKVRYLDGGREKFEHVVTATLPPVVKQVVLKKK